LYTLPFLQDSKSMPQRRSGKTYGNKLQ
jgi:hypothetical protein